MFRTIIAAAAVAFTATAVCAGDAGEDVIRLGPPLDNDVFAAASAWQASAPSETGRHGNAASDRVGDGGQGRRAGDRSRGRPLSAGAVPHLPGCGVTSAGRPETGAPKSFRPADGRARGPIRMRRDR